MLYMPFTYERLPTLVIGLVVGMASLRKEEKSQDIKMDY